MQIKVFTLSIVTTIVAVIIVLFHFYCVLLLTAIYVLKRGFTQMNWNSCSTELNLAITFYDFCSMTVIYLTFNAIMVCWKQFENCEWKCLNWTWENFGICVYNLIDSRPNTSNSEAMSEFWIIWTWNIVCILLLYFNCTRVKTPAIVYRRKPLWSKQLWVKQDLSNMNQNFLA